MLLPCAFRSGAGSGCPAEGKAIDPARRASAQAELRRALESASERAILLAGPAGSGKSSVLLALASELAPRRRAVYLTRPRLPLGGFWMRLASELDLEPGYDAKRRVLRRAAELAREGATLLLLVDDANELPAETLYALLATARSEPGLQLVLARADDAPLAGPLPDDVSTVRIGSPAPAPAAELPLEATTLPALTARRRLRERRARIAHAAGGLCAGLALGALVSAPMWRAFERGRTPAPPADVAAAPPNAAERSAPPIAASRPAPAPEPPRAFVPAPRAATPSVALPAPVPAKPRETVSAIPPLDAPAPKPAEPPAEAPAAVETAPAAAPPPVAERLPSTFRASVPEPPPPAPAPAPEAAPSAPPPVAAAPVAERAAPDVAAPPPPAPRPRSGPPAAGRLGITSDSPIRIEIDGRSYGSVPLVGVQLPRGEHRVTAHYPDGAVALKTIYLDAENVAVFFR